MRKFLVKNFVFSCYVTLFGKTIGFVRSARVLFPLFALVGMIIGTDPNYPALQWWDFLLLGFLAIVIWIGFGAWNWGYFRLFPFTYGELDDEQKYKYLDGISQGVLKNPLQDYKYGFLVDWQVQEFESLQKQMKDKYSKNFAGFTNLLPTIITIISIIVWTKWIFPFFN